VKREKKKYKIEPTNYSITLRATHKEERYPIAYASIVIEEKDNKKIGKLVGMLRKDEFKNYGICKDLILKRIDLCKELNCNQVYTAVYYKRKGLIKLYKSLGFKEIKPLTEEYVRLILDINY